MKMGANYLFSRGDVVPQNTNPSQWNWNNLDASRQGAQMDWRRVGARLDARCDARTEQEKREDPLPDPDRRRPEQKSSSSIKEEAPVPK